MKKEVDIIFLACTISIILIDIITAIGFFTGNHVWYNATLGPWIVFVFSLIAGAVRTLQKKG